MSRSKSMLEHAYVQRRPAHLNFQQRAGGCVHRGLGRDGPRRVERSRVGRQGVEIVPVFGATAPPVTPNGLCVRLNMCHKNQSGEKVSCYVRKKREHREDQRKALQQNPTWTLFQQRTARVRMMAATQQLVMEMITIGRIWRSSGTSGVWMSAYVEM